MIVYVLLILWFLLVNSIIKPVFWVDRFGRGHFTARKIQVLLTMGVIILVFGLRSGVADTPAYIRVFEGEIPVGFNNIFSLSNYEGKGVLFRAIGILCKSIVNDYHFYLTVIAALSGLLIASVLRNNSDYYGDAIVLFMLSGMYTWMLNGIRQFLAVSVTFFCANFLKKRQLIFYVLTVLIAMGIHRTAIIALPLYFVVRGRAWNARTLLLILGGILAVVFIDKFTNLLNSAIEGTEYELYTGRFSTKRGSSIIHTVIYSVPIVLAFLRRQRIERIAPPIINICINMSIVTAVISLIANFTSGVLIGALSIYFSMYSLILLPWLINEAYPDHRRVLTLVMYSCYTALFFMVHSYPYYSDILFGGKWYSEW